MIDRPLHPCSRPRPNGLSWSLNSIYLTPAWPERMGATKHHRSRMRGKAFKNQLSSNFCVILFCKTCSSLTAKLRSYRRRSKRPPIPLSRQPLRLKRISLRGFKDRRSDAVDHHRDVAPQLHETFLNHGKHGRQQRSAKYSAENPGPMPASPRRIDDFQLGHQTRNPKELQVIPQVPQRLIGPCAVTL
jgi:hypothetical protein